MKLQLLLARHAGSGKALIWAVLWLGAVPYLGALCHGSPALEAKVRAQPSAKAYADLGTWFRDRRQFECAAEAFEKALKLKPDSASLAYLQGASLYSAGNAKEAIVSLQRSVRLDSKLLPAHLKLGAAFDDVHDTMNAELEWRAALALDPKSATARIALSKDLLAEEDYGSEIALLGPASSSGQLPISLTLDLALAYGQMGRLQDANELLRTALRTHPSSLSLAKALSGTLVLQARKEEAASILETALKQHPGDMSAQLLYLRILVMQDETAKAHQLGSKLLKATPPNWEVLYLIGVLEQRAGEYTAACDHLQQAVALNPDHSESRHNLGSVLAKLKDNQGAREQLEKAITLGSRDPEVRFELAAVLRAMGENEQAQEQFKLYQQEAQEKSDLTQAAAKAAFADQKVAAGEFRQAADLYREALAAAPREASLAYKLAMALDKLGDTVNERLALEQTIQIDPNMAEAQNQLGYLALRTEETGSAEEHFRMAVHASPGFAKAWVNLAATLYLESKLPEAKEAVERALQAEPANPQAQKLKSVLDSGQPPP